MELDDALRWTAINRAIVAGSLVVALALVAIGFAAGFGGATTSLFTDPANAGEVVADANPAITIAFSLLGLVVWQFGKTYALFATLPPANGEAATDRFDNERLKSDVLQALDERLAEMEEDVAETRRSVQELKREEHAASFDDGTRLGSSSTSNATTGSNASGDASLASSSRSGSETGSPNARRSQSGSADRSESDGRTGGPTDSPPGQSGSDGGSGGTDASDSTVGSTGSDSTTGSTGSSFDKTPFEAVRTRDASTTRKNARKNEQTEREQRRRKNRTEGKRRDSSDSSDPLA